MKKLILAIALSTAAIPALAVTPSGKWTPISVKDGLEGNVGTGVELVGVAEGDRSRRQFPAEVYVACVKNETRVLFSYGGTFVHFTPYTKAKYRIDERPIQNMSVSAAQNHGAFGMWNGTGIDFLKSLKGGKELRVQTVDTLLGNKVDFTFKLGDAAEAIAPVAAKCGWKL